MNPQGHIWAIAFQRSSGSSTVWGDPMSLLSYRGKKDFLHKTISIECVKSQYDMLLFHNGIFFYISSLSHLKFEFYT